MSQLVHPQQAQECSTLARFQLAKYSYASTSVSHRGPLTWSHVFGNGNIIGIFERHTTFSTGRVLFRVVNNLATLEEICITDFMNESIHQVHSSQESSRRPSFAVVVKLPCLAIKYPQGPAYIRRFQIKFSTEKDYYSALAVLSEINCPFSESSVNSVRPVSRPATALSSFSHVGSGSSPSMRLYPSTATEPFTSSNGTHLPFRSSSIRTNLSTGTPASSMPPPHRSSSIISDMPSDTLLARPTSNPGTLSGTSRFFSSSSSNHSSSDDIHRASFRDIASTINLPSASTDPDPDRFRRPSTSTGYTGFHDVEDLPLPPKRDLPFPAAKAKRTRSSPEAADQVPTKKSTTDMKITDKPSVTSPLSPRDNILVLRILKRKKSPQRAKLKSRSSSSTIINTRDQTTTSTVTAPTPTPADATKPALHTTESALGTNSISDFPFPHQANANGDPTSAEIQSYLFDNNLDSEKTAKLENWICSLLENEEFCQLVVNLEGLWQRVLFGTGRVE